ATALASCCRLADPEQALLEQAAERLQLTARSLHRVLRVARTVADLDGSEAIARPHLAEALGYRAPLLLRDGGRLPGRDSRRRRRGTPPAKRPPGTGAEARQSLFPPGARRRHAACDGRRRSYLAGTTLLASVFSTL